MTGIEVLTWGRQPIFAHAVSSEPPNPLYGIGRLSEESDSWIGSIEFSQKTVLYQYTTCYHWAMCQLGVGGVAIFPTNTTERVFGSLVAHRVHPSC
eukprot:s711_g3.t1